MELKRKTVEGALEWSAYSENFIAAWREAGGRTEEASGRSCIYAGGKGASSLRSSRVVQVAYAH
jgi:hypothetical protein